MVGPNLINALETGDRFRAWFEIRYNSNKDNVVGHQKRRYYESELFGLFNDRNNPSEDEINNIIDTLGKRIPGASKTYLQKIIERENAFEQYIESNAAANAKHDYQGLPFANQISHIGEAFRPLAKELLNRHLPEDISDEIKQQIKNMVFDGQVLPGITNQKGEIAVREYPKHGVTAEQQEKSSPINDPSKTNLLVGLPTEEVKDKEGKITSYEYHALTFKGSAGKDVMVGGNKGNTMDAGDGDDYLVAGKGKDTLKGGKGNDLYIFKDMDAAKGDIIEDSDGGKIWIGNTRVGSERPQYTGGNTWVDSNFSYTLSITGKDKGSLIIADKKDATKTLTVKDWTYEKYIYEYYVRGKLPDEYSFEVISGKFGIVLKKSINGINTENEIRGDQVAPFKSDGKTYNWEATQWNYENGQLIGGKKEAGFNDVLRGTEGRDYIRGFGGNDAIEGGAGRDVLEGGEGGDLLVGGYGSDYLYGGNGNDVLFATGRLKTDLQRIQAGETVRSHSTNGLPLLTDGSVWGTYGYELVGVISGLDTDSDSVHKNDETNTRGDTLVGGQGKDTLVGSQENDTLYGDEQSPASQEDKSQGDIDTIYGKGGNDVIYGGAGDDVLCGDGDTNDEGSANSYFTKMPDDARPGNDIIHGNTGNDTIFGCEGNDIVHGDEDDDILRGNDGNDFLDGGEGDDTVGGDNGDDILHGGDGNDILTGDNARSVIDFGTKTGNDIIYGGAGADWLFGGYGNDQLHGGDGNDHLAPGPGNDYMTGGTGNDVFHIYREGMEHKVIADFGDWDAISLRDTRLDDYLLSQSGNDLLMTLKSGEGQLLVKNYFSLAPDAPSVIAEMGGQTLLQPQKIFDRIKAQEPQSGEEQPQDENADSAVADNAAQPQAEDAAADQEHHAQPEPPTAALQESAPPQLLSAEGNPFAAASPVMAPLLNLDHARAAGHDAHSPAANTTPALTLHDEAQLPQWGDLLADTGEHATLVAPLAAHASLHERHDDEYHAPDATLRHAPLADSTQHLLEYWQHQSGLL